MRVNTTVACDWLNFEFQSLRLILVATGSRRANIRFSKESPRVDYCYTRGNQQREFFVNLLVRRRRFGNKRKSVDARISDQSRDLKSVDGLLYLLVTQSKEQCDAVLNNEEGTSGEQPRVARDNYLDAGSVAGRINSSR
ncbi:hypothetical protein F511_40752 [Dorcoceras hygrometricum]|uniref:Uncharacterized protein n=1 Tax=Dorcoceras hygrometricum TaxID=472368 RepID=A0A2Z7AXV9_9LAMI|nr:hypothetical protein F511_40752 [Dorcoceras hygrometricum]